MKASIFTLSVLLAFISVIKMDAQDPVDRIWRQVDSINSNFQAADENVMPMRWSHNTTLGTSYIFAPRVGSAMNYFVAPHANFSATDRLSFHGGFMASHTMPLSYVNDGEMSNVQAFNSMSAFVSASYRLTENLFIHGTGIKSLALFPGEGINSNLTFQDISFGATYFIGNFSIGASFHRSNNSYLSSPFGLGGPMTSSPFYW